MIVNYDVYLAHYGVQGMKWGVRRDRITSGSSSTSPKQNSSQTDKYKKAIPKGKFTEEERAKSLAESKDKSLRKVGIDPNKPPKEGSGWRPTKKQVVVTLLGAAAVAYLVYEGRQLSNLKDIAPGTLVSESKYNALVSLCQTHAWGPNGYIQPSSFDRPAFSIQPGQVFHRLSTQFEKEHHGPTYATASLADFARYTSAYRKEVGVKQSFFEVNFTAEREIRVPDLTTTLDAFRKAFQQTTGMLLEEKAVIQLYNGNSGGPWRGDTAEAFFSILKGQGFSAIVDEMDAGVIGELPLVVFDTDAVSQRTSRDLRSSDLSELTSSITEISNRKWP